MSANPSSPPKTALLQIPQVLSRPHSELEFDSGINTSAAWTVSLASPEGGARLSLNSISSARVDPNTVLEEQEEELEPDATESIAGDDSFDDQDGRPARALYGFQGKAEFRELTNIEAGDELEVMREDVGEGWSLARLARTAEEREDSAQGNEIGLIPRSYYIVRPSSLTPAVTHL